MPAYSAPPASRTVHAGAIADFPTAITWGDNQFVAVCGSGAIFTSPDGITWTPQTSATTGSLAAVAWGGGQFVAVGGIGTAPVNGHMGKGVILTSRDGQTWTNQEPNSELGDTIDSILYAGGQYVAGGSAVDIFGDHDPTPVYTSTDGVAWSRHVLFAAPGPAMLGLAYNGTRYVAVGGASALSPQPRTVVSSTDAITWDVETLPDALNLDSLYAVTWTGSRFVAVGGFGAVLTSPDGVTWGSDFTGSSGYFTAVGSANGTCVAGGVFGLIMANTRCDAAADTTKRVGAADSPPPPWSSLSSSPQPATIATQAISTTEHQIRFPSAITPGQLAHTGQPA